MCSNCRDYEGPFDDSEIERGEQLLDQQKENELLGDREAQKRFFLGSGFRLKRLRIEEDSDED